MIDDVGQELAEALQQLVARQAALGGERLDLVGTEGAAEIAGRDLLVGTVADPGIRGVAVTFLLELVEQVAEPAAQNAASRAACQKSAQSALEHVAKPAAR